MKSSVLALMFFALSCDLGEPPSPPPQPPPAEYVRTIDLVVEDVGVIDAVLRVRFLDTVQTRVFQICRNGQPFITHSLLAADTLIIDTALAPNHAYLYQAYRVHDTARIDSSLDTTVTTMDTTSHDFTFETFYFGGSSSSELRDVAIIGENNIWAAGEFFESTSPNPYSATHFDGAQWTLHRFYYRTTGGDSLLITPIRGVLAFGDSELWLAAGSVFRWRSDSITPFLLRGSILFGNETVERVFGTSVGSIYGVGNAGTMVHYNGVLWRKILSGTLTDIQDVWGINGGPVLAAVSNIASPGDHKILSIDENGVVDSTNWISSRRVNSIWFKKTSRMFASGDGVHMRGPDKVWRRQEGIPLYYTRRIRGNDINDVFVVSDFGMTAHFNGVSWKVFPGNFNDTFYSCDMKDNLMVAVGERGSQAIVVVARR